MCCKSWTYKIHEISPLKKDFKRALALVWQLVWPFFCWQHKHVGQSDPSTLRGRSQSTICGGSPSLKRSRDGSNKLCGCTWYLLSASKFFMWNTWGRWLLGSWWLTHSCYPNIVYVLAPSKVRADNDFHSCFHQLRPAWWYDEKNNMHLFITNPPDCIIIDLTSWLVSTLWPVISMQVTHCLAVARSNYCAKILDLDYL